MNKTDTKEVSEHNASLEMKKKMSLASKPRIDNESGYCDDKVLSLIETRGYAV